MLKCSNEINMFSLIFYCGLISFVVSARSNNDTLHDGVKLNISTTLSTLPSTTIPVSKDCVLEMKESEISQIVELFNRNFVNVVDIHVSFSGTGDEKHLLSDFHVSLFNPIGREILYTLAREELGSFPWTLNAGVRNIKLHFKENQNECIKREENATDFALENTQNIIRSINLETNHEVCSSYKGTSSGEVKRTCCQITKSNSTKFNDGCSEPKSFLHRSSVLWDVISVVLFVFAWFYLLWLLFVFLSCTEFDLRYSEYKIYKLEESRMSASFILFKMIWERNSCLVSFIRSCVLIGVLSCIYYLRYWPIIRYWSNIYHVILGILLVFWGVSFSISCLYRPKIPKAKDILEDIKNERNSRCNHFHFEILEYFGHNVDELRQEFDSGEFTGVIKVLTFPFNINLWREIIKKLPTFTTCVEDTRFRNEILKFFALCPCHILAVSTRFLYVCIVFHFLIILVIIHLVVHTALMLALIQNLEYEKGFSPFLDLFHQVGLLVFLLFALIATIPAILSFLLGLFLNLVYFIPYFAFFAVLIFYCCSYWKTMEEKYCVLKRLIYEACRDKQGVNNGCIPNRHPKREEKVLPVVSKELYDKIREELLPYDINLFYFGLKIFWSFAFSFGILQLINMLNEFNVTGVVQVVTTASLGIIPHIFNIVGLRTSEESKKAWEEKLKLNVKYMVEESVGEDSKRARTVLIMEEHDDGTTSEDSELVKVTSDSTTANDRTTDDTTTNDTTADDTTANDTTANDTTADDTTTNDTTTNDTTADDTTANDTTADDTTADDTTANDTTADDTTANDTTANDTRADDTTANDTAANDTTADDTTTNDTTADDTTVDDTTANDTTADDTTANDTTADDTTADD